MDTGGQHQGQAGQQSQDAFGAHGRPSSHKPVHRRQACGHTSETFEHQKDSIVARMAHAVGK
eukprot:765448-Hanusia_phi.AAC.7